MVFSKLGAVKLVASGLVGIGTGKIVKQVLNTHVTAESTFDKASIFAASFVIGSMATEATKAYTDGMIDNVVKTYSELKQVAELAPRLGRINRNESTFEKEGLIQAEFIQNEEGKWVPIKVNDESIRVTIKK